MSDITEKLRAIAAAQTITIKGGTLFRLYQITKNIKQLAEGGKFGILGTHYSLKVNEAKKLIDKVSELEMYMQSLTNSVVFSERELDYMKKLLERVENQSESVL